MKNDKRLSTREASWSLGLSPRYVRTLITSGKLPATRRGHHYRIQPADLALVSFQKRRRTGSRSALPANTDAFVESFVEYAEANALSAIASAPPNTRSTLQRFFGMLLRALGLGIFHQEVLIQQRDEAHDL